MNASTNSGKMLQLPPNSNLHGHLNINIGFWDFQCQNDSLKNYAVYLGVAF